MTTSNLPAPAALPRRRLLRVDAPGTPKIRFLLRLPENPRADRVLIAVHGISREPDVMIRWLAPQADEHGYTLVAPEFDAHAFNDFQRLGRTGRGQRADLTLLNIMARTRGLLGDDTSPAPHLVGFSGGAQFGHRFIYAHPGHVASATLVSAGWYTPPRSRRRFPAGLGACEELPDLHFDGDALARTPTLVIVGTRDTEVDRSVRSTSRLNRQQGRHRLARARWFHLRLLRHADSISGAAPHRFEELPRTGHDFAEAVREGGLAERLFEFLGEVPAERQASGARHEEPTSC